MWDLRGIYCEIRMWQLVLRSLENLFVWLKSIVPRTVTHKWPSSRELEEKRDLFSLEVAACWVKIASLNLNNSGWHNGTWWGRGIQSQHDGCIQLCSTYAVTSCQVTRASAVLLVCFSCKGPSALVWVMRSLILTEGSTKNCSVCAFSSTEYCKHSTSDLLSLHQPFAKFWVSATPNFLFEEAGGGGIDKGKKEAV